MIKDEDWVLKLNLRLSFYHRVTVVKNASENPWKDCRTRHWATDLNNHKNVVYDNVTNHVTIKSLQ